MQAQKVRTKDVRRVFMKHLEGKLFQYKYVSTHLIRFLFLAAIWLVLLIVIHTIQDETPYEFMFEIIEVYVASIALAIVLVKMQGRFSRPFLHAEISDTVAAALAELDERTGIFRLSKSTKTVYLSPFAMEVFDVRPPEGKEVDYTCAFAGYQKILERLQSVGDEDGILIQEGPGGKKMVKVTADVVYRDDSIVGAVQDYTSRILAQIKREDEKELDPLTRLYTRNAFMHRAEEAIAKDEGKVGVMFYIDLGDVGIVNHSFGHEYGDLYIKRAAEHIRLTFPSRSLVARIYGDELLAFDYGLMEKDDGYAEKIAKELSEARVTMPNGEVKKAEATCGYAWYTADSDSIEQLVGFAYNALREAKKSGRGTALSFDRRAYFNTVSHIRKHQAFDALVDKNLLHYEFQPIVDVRGGRIFAYEALMRPDMEEFHSPLDVLSAARGCGKLQKVEELTHTNVFEWIASNEHALNGRKIFFNTIPNQFVLDDEHPELLKLFMRYGRHTVMEITEEEPISSSFLDNKAHIVRKFSGNIALDDYGVGYSNNNVLLLLTPGFVKIDMSLISNIHQLERKKLLVENIVGYCKKMGVKTIAEGVEEIGEAEEVVKMGVDYVQGYYIARPGPKIDEPSLREKERIAALCEMSASLPRDA